MAKPFRDRTEAGQLLAAKLAPYAQRPDVLVLALPRGGVPVAYEVARAVGAPLDVYLVRKLGVPGHELRAEVDEIVCAITPEPFYAVGLWYEDFAPPTDDEIRTLLDRAAQEHAATAQRR